MASPQRGMGRGLAAILAPTEANREPMPELRRLPVELIAPNPLQPRKLFDEDALVALSESVKERGVVQPVIVRPSPGGTYELIAGERRWRAARLAGLELLPAVVATHGELESLEIALIENMAREDLNPIEEARACSLLVDEFGLTREEVGRRVGRGRVAVSNLMRLLDLPDEVLDLLSEGRLTEGHGRALLTAPDHGDRRRLARAAVDEEWTVRETEAQARETTRPTELKVSRSPEIHPDQEEAATRLGDVLGRAFGTDVKVKPRGTGYSVALTFDSLDEALQLASRLEEKPGA